MYLNLQASLFIIKKVRLFPMMSVKLEVLHLRVGPILACISILQKNDRKLQKKGICCLLFNNSESLHLVYQITVTQCSKNSERTDNRHNKE